MDTIDCLVIGAGVVGLAIARELALAGREVLIVESESNFGLGISSRNSEVIHAGLYYPPASLKARACVEGRGLLYRYCAERQIAHRNTGKLIVATDIAQLAKLDAIAANAAACGVTDLLRLDARQARALEPALRCEAALLSPSTGIVDARGLMTALLADAEAAGASLALNTAVVAGTLGAGAHRIATRGRDGADFEFAAKTVVNAAGLGAVSVAQALAGLPRDRLPRQRLARGCYFALAGKSPFSRLVYPVPVDGGLGVHLTLDLAGQARFGPDVDWIDAVDYSVNPARGDAFYAEIRRYWPELADGALLAAYAGIRPKISGPGEPAADFRIDGPADHGVPGLVNLFGIESPGLTASLAIARAVADLLSR
jgi:L-2-hydroxyglutarate oxidase LhgO